MHINIKWIECCVVVVVKYDVTKVCQLFAVETVLQCKR